MREFKKKKPTGQELCEKVRKKVERFERAISGDTDAMFEVMYERGMCTKEDLDEYYKSKKIGS